MNWLDWLLAAILAWAVVEGVWKGFSRLAFGLAGALAGLIGGLWFYGVAGAVFLPYVSSPALANFLGFVAIFAGAQAAGSLLAWISGKIFKAAGLTWLDRLLGAGFGLLRTVLIATALILALAAFPFRPVADSIARSRIAPYLIEVSNIAAAMAPKEIRDGFQRSYEELQKLWSKTPPAERE
jgi:membrane protein required for colicin V production